MKETIVRMLQEGCTYNQIIQEVGCSRPTVCYHAAKLGLNVNIDKPQYDWNAISEFYQTHSRIETIRHFGFAKATWDNAIKRGDIQSRGMSDVRLPLDKVLTENSKYGSWQLKLRLLKEGLLENCCSECGIGPSWNGKLLVLQLDHINGNPKDNRLHNVRILCPNCHTQTETWGRKRG